MKTILIVSYSGAIHASFGGVTREIFTRLHKSGKYNIIQHGWFHMDLAEEVPWKIIPTNMKRNDKGGVDFDQGDSFGQKTFAGVIDDVKPDLVWVLADFYMVKHIFEIKNQYPSTPFIFHVPVDGEPWSDIQTSHFHTADKVVALTEYGSEVIHGVSGRDTDYIYHGVDVDLFRPLGDERREQIITSVTGGRLTKDSFVIGWVGKDQYRKQVWKLWELLHYLRHGDYIQCGDCSKVTLMEYDKVTKQPRSIGKLRTYDDDYDYKTCSHCDSTNVNRAEPNEDVYGWAHMAFKPDEGWNPELLSRNWDTEGSVFLTHGLTGNRGVPIKDLVDIYNVFDCFYCMSGGEGFGLPVLEAMACELPVFYTKYSGHAEVVGDAGIGINSLFACETNSCFDRAQAITADAVAKILPYIKDRSLAREVGPTARARASKYTWDKIAKDWEVYIDKVAANAKQSMGVLV
jgi:glycosyltransferase involved in cell wall biosynthesis